MGSASRESAVTALLDAASRGDAPRVVELLDTHPDIINERGRLTGHSGLRTALHFAVSRIDETVIKALLDRGADPNIRDEGDNAMPLHFAAEKEHLGVIRLLIEHGADPIGAGDGHELEVIGWATCFGKGRKEVVQYLTAHGATHNIFSAVALGEVEIIRTLVAQSRGDLDKPMDSTNHRRSPLHLAVVKKQPQSLATLLELGADAERVDEAGMTPLDQAALAGETDMAELLIERGATLHLPAAIGLQRTADIERLVREDPDVLKPGHRWGTLIVRACEHAPAHVVEELIRLGASVDVRDDPATAVDGTSGYTPLHAAAFRGNAEVVSVLLKHGANPLAVDGKYGGTPSGWAEYAGYPDVRDLILAATAAGARQASGLGPLDLYDIDASRNRIRLHASLSEKDWDGIISVMNERQIANLDAGGQMTDALLQRISQLGHVTRLNLDGSNQLTDAGLLHLARMPQLHDLDVSGWKGQITDRGLEVLRHLPELRRFKACWQQGVSDAGAANLTFCDRLESVDLMGTPTGDGAIKALAGKHDLRRFKTGKQVTDAGLPRLHQFPIFKTWHGGAISCSLMSADAEPNHLLLDGPFTNTGLASLAGLSGLFALSLFWHISALTADGLERLSDLPNLGFLGCEGTLCNDLAMRHIAAMPRLRMLMAQGTVASDAGFAALSRSHTIEDIWGRECPNLTGLGFAALAAMPALRGLAVSCKNVDDAALSALPRFPALRELMPMDVQDEGFRHVGRCDRLEALWCMYCRETGDAATAHIGGLSNLKSYYAGQTRITDRTLEILGRMPSLERLEFWNCAGITDAGVTHLARLPRLREIHLSGLPKVTPEGAAVFPASIRVDYSA